MSETASPQPIGIEWDILPSDEMTDDLKEPVYAFRGALSATQGVVRECDFDRTLQLHDTVNPEKAINSFVLRNIVQRIRNKEERFWVSPEYTWLASAGLSQFSALRSSRAETSAHKVFFGVLHGGNPQGDEVLPVAVKPCSKNPFTATADWLNGRFATAANMKTLKPVGFLVSNGVGYSLTQLDKTIETLDNSNWTRVFRSSEDDPRYEGQRDLLHDTSNLLADIHSRNIFHGDPQLKNVALSVMGETFLIDWESAGFFKTEAPESVITNKSAHDLKVLFRSMAFSEKNNGVGLIDGFNHSVQWEIFNRHVITPYLEARLDIDPDCVAQLSEIEETLQFYVLNGDVYKSFRRDRRQA